jgi:hypothetical protein
MKFHYAMINKMTTIGQRIILFSTALGLVFVSAATAHAARLYIDPASSSYAPGQDFEAAVRLDTQKSCINAAGVSLRYPNAILQAVDFKQAGSIFSLWIDNGTIKQNYGTVSFTGGVPGGYCGKAAGDTGETNVLGTIIFRVATSTAQAGALTTADIGFLSDTALYLDDGLGTTLTPSTTGATYQILSQGNVTSSVWQQELQNDKLPPEMFQIGLYRDPSIFNGKYFITFSTIDKQTGVDHYEVLEQDANGNVKGTETPAVWKIATSPYLLTDQSLQSAVMVRATDKAGNQRTEILISQSPTNTGIPLLYSILSVSLAFILMTAAHFLMAAI